MKAIQIKNLGVAVLAAYAEYMGSVRRPVANVQITPGVNYVTFEKEYHIADTVGEKSQEAREPVTMVKRFEFKIYSSGLTYIEHWVYLEHDGYRLYDHEVDKAIIDMCWDKSDEVCTQLAVKKMMTLFRKNTARVELIDEVIAQSNQGRREKLSEIQASAFNSAAAAWNVPLPSDAKGSFRTAFRKD